jgi:hypothetical protein
VPQKICSQIKKPHETNGACWPRPFLAKGRGVAAGVGFLTLGFPRCVCCLHACGGILALLVPDEVAGRSFPACFARIALRVPVDCNFAGVNRFLCNRREDLQPGPDCIRSAGRSQWRDRGRISRPSRSPGQLNFHSQSMRRGTWLSNALRAAKKAKCKIELRTNTQCQTGGVVNPPPYEKMRSGGDSSGRQRMASIHQRPSIRIVA